MQELSAQQKIFGIRKFEKGKISSTQEDGSKKKVKTYSFDEAFQASLEYFKGDDLAAKVWANKYALKDSDGNLFEKTPDDMHRRLAGELARIEKNYKNPLSEQNIYELLKDFLEGTSFRL